MYFFFCRFSCIYLPGGDYTTLPFFFLFKSFMCSDISLTRLNKPMTADPLKKNHIVGLCYLPPIYIPMGHGRQPSNSVSKRHPLWRGPAALFEEEDPCPSGPGSSAEGHWTCSCDAVVESTACRRASMTSKSVSFHAPAPSCCCTRQFICAHAFPAPRPLTMKGMISATSGTCTAVVARYRMVAEISASRLSEAHSAASNARALSKEEKKQRKVSEKGIV